MALLMQHRDLPVDPPSSHPFFTFFLFLFIVLISLLLSIYSDVNRQYLLFTVFLSLAICYISSKIFYNFTRPARKIRGASDNFKRINWISNNNELIVRYEKWNDTVGPLIIGIHGWQSDSSSVEYKIQPFLDSGYHAIMIDLPGHGLSDGLRTWNAVESGERILSMLKIESPNWDSSRINSIVLFGHSIGGFVVLRHADRMNAILPVPISKVYLESPMTSFPLVYKQRTRYWKFIPGLLAKIDLRWAFIRDGPNIDIVWRNFAVPDWGIPTLPLRILQAKHDVVLGLNHVDLLKPYVNDDWDIILDPNLKHFGRGEARGDASKTYESWMKE